MAVLKRYLPEPLSAADLEALVRRVIAETGAASRKDMGRVMGALQPRVRGRADGKAVNLLVQSLLP
ncbi:MAG: GatB/YqeY domain-containing protein [Kiritimatiellia bacterium]